MNLTAPSYEHALEVLDMLADSAALLRREGWEVNLACESGPVDCVTFSARRTCLPPADERPQSGEVKP